MRIRRAAAFLLPGVAAVLTVAGTGGVAHAASQVVQENCYSNANTVISVTLQVGDTFTINTDALGDCSSAGTYSGAGPAPRGVGTTAFGPTGTEGVLPYNAGQAVINAGDRIIYTATAEGSVRITLEDNIFILPTAYQITVTASSNGGSNDVAAATAMGPSDVLQQVGRPLGGCAAISDPALNWSGVSSSGWGESWAQWVDGGRGGTVCSRTLAYSAASSSWFVL